MKSIYSYLILFFTISSGNILFCQDARSNVNKGVDLYEKGKYIDSEVEFKKGLEKSPDNFHSSFDLGDSYYKEGKYGDALRSYSEALPKANTDYLRSKVFHNIGNALLKDNKLKESVGAYTDALKLNPNDEQTKYNLSYALSLLKDQNKNQKNKDKNDKNKNDQDKNNQQNKDRNKNDQNKQNKDQNKNDQKKQQNQPQQQQDKMSKDQAQSIFNALNNDEKNLQKQLRRMKSEPIKTSKDW